MRVMVRADSGAIIGAGHVMRCLALSEELRERGADVRFVTRAHAGDLVHHVRECGFDVVPLARREAVTVDPSSWLGSTQLDDARSSLDAVADWPAVDWTIVDHYGVAAQWHRVLRAEGARVLAIDDVADRLLDVDVLVAPNFGANASTFDDLVDDRCTRLVGAEYTLISSAFREAAKRANRPLRPACEARVVVALGGADPNDATTDVLERIATVVALGHLDVVIGQAHPRPQRVRDACANLTNATLHVQPSTFAHLLADADVAIGAGGVSMWERMCIGVPAIVLPLAPNQVEGIEAVAAAGLIVALGDDWRAGSTLGTALRTMLGDLDQRARLSAAARATIDGEGSKRVADVLEAAA